MIKRRNIKAFTLVELLVVVVIIGILAAALIGRYQSFLQSGRDAARQAWLKEMATQLEKYRMDYGDTFIAYSGCVTNETSNPLYKGLVASWGYMNKLPTDPISTRAVYIGTWWTSDLSSVCKWYYFYSSLKVANTDNYGFFLAANAETPKGMNFTTGDNNWWKINQDPNDDWEALRYRSEKLCNRVVFSGSDSACSASVQVGWIKKSDVHKNWWWVVLGGW